MRTFVLFVLAVTAGILSANAKAGLIEIEIESLRLTPIIENNVAVTTDG